MTLETRGGLARCGFRELQPQERSPELQVVVDDETLRGLDPAQRVVMAWQTG